MCSGEERYFVLKSCISKNINNEATMIRARKKIFHENLSTPAIYDKINDLDDDVCAMKTFSVNYKLSWVRFQKQQDENSRVDSLWLCLHNSHNQVEMQGKVYE